MITVRNAVEEFLSPANQGEMLSTKFGPRASPFEKKLAQARRNSRAAFWIIAGMLFALFAVVLFQSWRSFDELVKMSSPGVVSVFGVSAAGAVTMLVGVSREWSRAEYLLIMLEELRSLDPQKFTTLVMAVAVRWYRLRLPS